MPPTPFRSTQEQVVASLRAAGITNQYAINAIVANIRKEQGGFEAKRENTNYSNTPNDREQPPGIRQVFTFLTPANGFSDEVLNTLKKDVVAFTDTVYGGRPGGTNNPQFRRRDRSGGPFLGNSQVDDGYKYRGRGFIQITGKSNYQSTGNGIGKDLVNNPDLLVTDYPTSIAAAIYYLKTHPILQGRDQNGEYDTPKNFKVRGQSFQTFPDGIAGMNAFDSQLKANRAVTAAIAGGVELLQKKFFRDLLAKVNNFTGISGAPTGIPTVAASTEYFDRTYVQPLRPVSNNNQNVKAYLDALLQKKILVSSAQNKPLQDTVTSIDISGEIALLGSTSAINVEFQEQQKSVLSRIDGLLPAEAAFAVQYDLFELYPDKMREAMAINAGSSPNPLYSHAWRSPGKLAITVNLTIPGASGFSIGQIFRVGRTYDYRTKGAFQLFGLTETIDTSRGWTTELYARFNAMPLDKIEILESE